jgi:hypothetical protein
MIEKRAMDFDRRCGKDRRRSSKFRLLLNNKIEKRRGEERRSGHEQRQGWVKLDKWSSARLERLKIAKFLH